MALQPTRTPRLALLVLLLEQPLVQLLTQELEPEPLPERPQLVLQVPPRMQELQLPPLARPPVLPVMQAPRQARRPRSRPKVQLRQPLSRSYRKSTS